MANGTGSDNSGSDDEGLEVWVQEGRAQAAALTRLQERAEKAEDKALTQAQANRASMFRAERAEKERDNLDLLLSARQARLERAEDRVKKLEAALRDMTTPPVVFSTDDATDVASWFVTKAERALIGESAEPQEGA